MKTYTARVTSALLLLALLLLTLLSSGSPLAQTAQGFLVPEYDVLALDDEIRDVLDREVKPIRNKERRLKRLHELLYSPSGYNIHYEPEGTHTAIDTFYTGSGNCMSLTNLFVAAARHVGLKTSFQSVKVKREWQPNGNFYEMPGHINAIVELINKHAVVEFNNTIAVGSRGETRYTKISDRQAKAEFYNNLAADLLADGKTEHSIAYFEKAIKTHKRLHFVWSNMGVALKRAGRLEDAEQAYLKALRINPLSKSAIGNIYILYKQTGQEKASAVYAKRAEKYARQNPYHLNKLASESIDKGDYDAAVKLAKSAISKYKMAADFHYHLAIAYYYQQQHDLAKQSLETAQDINESEEYKHRYQREIDALATLN